MICEDCKRLRTETEQLRTALTEREAREARVRELHEGEACHHGDGCGYFCNECEGDWPCPTIRALDGDERTE